MKYIYGHNVNTIMKVYNVLDEYKNIDAWFNIPDEYVIENDPNLSHRMFFYSLGNPFHVLDPDTLKPTGVSANFNVVEELMIFLSEVCDPEMERADDWKKLRRGRLLSFMLDNDTMYSDGSNGVVSEFIKELKKKGDERSAFLHVLQNATLLNSQKEEKTHWIDCLKNVFLQSIAKE